MATIIDPYPDRKFILVNEPEKTSDHSDVNLISKGDLYEQEVSGEVNLPDKNTTSHSSTPSLSMTRRSFLRVFGMFLTIVGVGGFSLFGAQDARNQNSTASKNGGRVAKATRGYGPGAYGR